MLWFSFKTAPLVSALWALHHKVIIIIESSHVSLVLSSYKHVFWDRQLLRIHISSSLNIWELLVDSLSPRWPNTTLQKIERSTVYISRIFDFEFMWSVFIKFNNKLEMIPSESNIGCASAAVCTWSCLPQTVFCRPKKGLQEPWPDNALRIQSILSKKKVREKVPCSLRLLLVPEY